MTAQVEGRRGSRYCPRCPRSPMRRDGRVHLHELQVDAWFQVPGANRPLQVQKMGQCTVLARGPAHQEQARFQTATGVKEFPYQSRQQQHLAPAAEVFPLTRMEGSHADH